MPLIAGGPLARPAPPLSKSKLQLSVAEALPSCRTPQAFPAEIEGPVAWAQPLCFLMSSTLGKSLLCNQALGLPEWQTRTKTLNDRINQVGCKRQLLSSSGLRQCGECLRGVESH